MQLRRLTRLTELARLTRFERLTELTRFEKRTGLTRLQRLAERRGLLDGDAHLRAEAGLGRWPGRLLHEPWRPCGRLFFDPGRRRGPVVPLGGR